MSVRSFEEIISDVFRMKQELLLLHHVYSPEAANYHQLKQINSLAEQVRLAQEKLTGFSSQLQANKQAEVTQQRELQEENTQLLALNQQLVVSNDKFKTLLENTQRQKQELERRLEEEREGWRAIEARHLKEVQNLKLMQAQQLYMLRKKEKKSN